MSKDISVSTALECKSAILGRRRSQKSKSRKYNKKKKTELKPSKVVAKKNPKYIRRVLTSRPKLDKYDYIKSPLCTESAVKQIEKNNTLVFLCNPKATKKDIKRSLVELYGLKITKVNTLIRMDGQKKAYVRLDVSMDASEIASKIGFI